MIASKLIVSNCVLSFNELVKYNKIIEMVERVDLAPRKWFKIIQLHDLANIYKEIRRKIYINLTKCDPKVSKFLKIYKKTQSQQNKTGNHRQKCSTLTYD